MPRTSISLSRTGTVLALSSVTVLLLALPAAAHVTVSSDDNTRGTDDAVLTFRVPNEQDKATVTKLQVTFPTDDPIASVSAIAKTGWTVASTPVTFPKPIVTDDGTITTGTGSITWSTSAATGIPVGQADLFQALVGPLPDAPQVSFRAVQTYSDGTVVSWIEPTIAGQPDPDHPAPILKLTAAGATPSDTSTASTPTPVTAAISGTNTSDTGARTLGIVGIVVGAIGVATGGFAVSRSRRASSASSAASTGRL
jgi:uncharacterized protein YcnI